MTRITLRLAPWPLVGLALLLTGCGADRPVSETRPRVYPPPPLAPAAAASAADAAPAAPMTR